MADAALEPFYGGTYFPPEARWGRPGFVEMLEEIARVWREERARSSSRRQRSSSACGACARTGAAGAVPGHRRARRAVAEFAARSIARRGGFGNAPKFPRPSELLFLLREHARTGATEPRDMVLVTLRAMALGGMRDHIGGGFHRYSVDADWRVPHFEKMLYDQAQLVLAYVEAAQVTGDRFFADVAVDTLDYVRRDLTAPGGGFYSAEDADSVPPEQAQRGSSAQDGGRLLHLARRGDSARCLARMPTSSARATASCPTATRRSTRRTSSRTRTCSIRRDSLEDVASTTGRSVDEVGRCPARSREACCDTTGDAPAAASRRQGPDRVERPDDCRVRAGRAHARRR